MKKNMSFLDKLIELITLDKGHIYKGKGGNYFKTGGNKSGRKGRTIWWWQKK